MVMIYVKAIRVMLYIILMWLLKSPLNQNLIVIHHKSNNYFKSQISFGGIKEDKRIVYSITLYIKWLLLFANRKIFKS
jgi:hypothetical protein